MHRSRDLTRHGWLVGRQRSEYHEDAERVSFGVRVDPEWFFGILGAVVEKTSPELKDPSVLGVELRNCPNRHVQMELLRHRVVRPRRLAQVVDLLERNPSLACVIVDDQPVNVRLDPRAGPWPSR